LPQSGLAEERPRPNISVSSKKYVLKSTEPLFGPLFPDQKTQKTLKKPKKNLFCQKLSEEGQFLGFSDFSKLGSYWGFSGARAG